VQSVFTRYLIEGIESGAADNAGTGQIRLNELYNYVRSSLKREAPNQTPQPYYYGLDGSSVVVALNPSPKVAELPEALRQQIESSDSHVKGAAVDDLYKLAVSGGPLSTTAIAELHKLKTDDSFFVQGVAERALGRLGVKSSSANKPTSAHNEPNKDLLEKQKRARDDALKELMKTPSPVFGIPLNKGNDTGNKLVEPENKLLEGMKLVLSIIITGLLMIGYIQFFGFQKTTEESANIADAMAVEAVAGAENAADASMEAMANGTDNMAADPIMNAADAMAAGADAMADKANEMKK
jgi:hypothetical protein